MLGLSPCRTFPQIADCARSRRSVSIWRIAVMSSATTRSNDFWYARYAPDGLEYPTRSAIRSHVSPPRRSLTTSCSLAITSGFGIPPRGLPPFALPIGFSVTDNDYH